MNYTELAEQFMQSMVRLQRHRPQKQISESVHGGSFVLYFISVIGGNVTPSEISAEMQISTARIAAVLGNLEKKGLVTRQIDPNDRRRILVDLTEQGRERAKEHQQRMLEMMAQILSQLGESDAREYVRITGRLAQMKPPCRR